MRQRTFSTNASSASSSSASHVNSPSNHTANFSNAQAYLHLLGWFAVICCSLAFCIQVLVIVFGMPRPVCPPETLKDLHSSRKTVNDLHTQLDAGEVNVKRLVRSFRGDDAELQDALVAARNQKQTLKRQLQQAEEIEKNIFIHLSCSEAGKAKEDFAKRKDIIVDQSFGRLIDFMPHPKNDDHIGLRDHHNPTKSEVLAGIVGFVLNPLLSFVDIYDMGQYVYRLLIVSIQFNAESAVDFIDLLRLLVTRFAFPLAGSFFLVFIQTVRHEVYDGKQS